MPLFSLLYFFFIFSNFGFPGTANFVGEFFILIGTFAFSNAVAFLSSFAMILSLVYSLFFYSRIFFGVLPQTFVRYYCDVSRLEFSVLAIFCTLVLYFGVFPVLLVDYSFLSLFKYTIFSL